MACHLEPKRHRPYRHWRAAARTIVNGIIAGGARQLITMPPRHCKSTLASFWTPTWFLEHFPDRRVILGSYQADFAASWGRKVRSTINDHPDDLTVRIRRDSSAVDRWDTTEGGGMTTAGVGGPITGKGADLLIIDDPIKNYQQALSETYRKTLWEWWQSTAYTRLEPGASIIVLATRWHEDDLTGRLLAHQEDEDGEKWELINFPAVAETDDQLGREPGQCLCPERYDEAALARIKRGVGSLVWSSLFQQHPSPPEGGMFKRAWFTRNLDPQQVPSGGVRYWDLAATEESSSDDPDYTVGTRLVDMPGSDDVCVADVVRLREGPDQVEKTIRATAERDGYDVPIFMEQEGGASGKSLISYYRRRVLAGFTVVGVPPRANKVVRAMPFSAACERRSVALARANWVEAWIDELATFPNASHDDQVDSVAGAYQKLKAGAATMSADDLGKIFGDQS